MSTGAAPLNYFLHAHGPASAPTMLLGWIFTAIAVAACVVVGTLLTIAILRRRPAGTGLVTSAENGLKWVALGTGISSVILLCMTVYALMVLNRVGTRPVGPGIDINVTAYDWWWAVEYPGTGADSMVTANEIHIPVGVPVRLRLDSADVIHAFWVPQLAGKTQMIPGVHNEQWLQADTPGIYTGQCTQYCGVQHAHMGFEVIAETPQRYAAWRAAQGGDAKVAMAGTVSEGRTLFVERCAGCHTVRGTAAAGAHAPDLTHVQSRHRIAAGVLLNTPENLMNWITHAQDYKPGSRMPSMPLSPAESAHLAAFLATLQ
jgi:cytochrome c oxidase subunit 2